MANGLNMSRQSDTWRMLESPLREVDSLLSTFAANHGMRLSRNYHNWPERTLGWTSRGLQRGIQIALDNPGRRTYSVRACASTGSGRTWLSNESILRKGQPWPKIGPITEDLLIEAYNTAELWSKKDLNSNQRINVSAILRRPH